MTSELRVFHSFEDAERADELLSSLAVEYIIIVGGHAVTFDGYPRFTGDIDFLVRPTRENAERLLGTLKAFGFAELALTVDDFTRLNTVERSRFAAASMGFLGLCAIIDA